MAAENGTETTATAPAVDGAEPAGDGTYELLLGRLRAAAGTLESAATELNAQRSTVFAAEEVVLTSTERITTEFDVTAVDIAEVGGLILVGHNVAVRQQQFKLSQVFSVFELTDSGGVADADVPQFLTDPRLLTDLNELYTYYREARLESLRFFDDKLCAVFGLGGGARRVLWWRIAADGSVTYADVHGEKLLRSEDRYDFTWTVAGRDSLADAGDRHLDLGAVRIAIEGGQLTFWVDDGVGGHTCALREDLEVVEQDLADVAVSSATVGDLVLLKVLPYRESVERHYVAGRLTRTVTRDDALGTGARTLSDGAGVISPGSFHLAGGQSRTYALVAGDWQLSDILLAPNGEDVFYAYHDDIAGQYLLCGYNKVTKAMANPITCEGWTVLADGTMVVLRETAVASKVHSVSLYDSPFCAPELYQPLVAADSFLGKVGNTDLVSVLGECFALVRDLDRITFNEEAFSALVTRSRRVIDVHPWMAAPETSELRSSIEALAAAAADIVAGFAATAVAKRDAREAQLSAAADTESYVVATGARIDSVDRYIELIVAGRTLRGQLAGLTERPHIDLDAVAELDQRVADAYSALAEGALRRLGADDATAGLEAEIAEARASGTNAPDAQTAVAAGASLVATGEKIDALIEVVSSLDVADTVAVTKVLESLTELLAARNAAAAAVTTNADRLARDEGAERFAAAVALLSQRSAAAVATAGTVEAVEAALGALSSELDSLEARFGDVLEFANELADRRDEMYRTLMGRRDALVAAETARLDHLVVTARRALTTIETRAAALGAAAEFEGFFATDPMVARVRATIATLNDAGAAGRGAELAVALDAARQRARLSAVDRAELHDADGNVRLGRHTFAMNHTPLDVTLSADIDGNLTCGISGTDLAMPVDAVAEFGEDAARITSSGSTQTDTLAGPVILAFDAVTDKLAVTSPEDTVALRAEVTRRGADGFTLGVTDADAARIVCAVRDVFDTPGLWHDPRVRAVANRWLAAQPDQAGIEATISAISATGDGAVARAARARHDDSISEVANTLGVDVSSDAVFAFLAGGYGLGVSAEAGEVASAVTKWADSAKLDLGALSPAEAALVISDWAAMSEREVCWARCVEAAEVICAEAPVTRHRVRVRVDGLLSEHPTISNGTLELDVDVAWSEYETWRRDERHASARAAKLRRDWLSAKRAELGVEEMRPGTAVGFVRNSLVNEVYLPAVAENLSRQLGLSGAAQGLLMLISPPGYGKTMLMTYIADLLGYALVKIDGPALGDKVTSLDPAQAPDAASAAELEKLNLAFAMGSNVICYVDDIQHTSVEFLSRFIPLCDSTRRIDGVLNGEARTFNLSGKRFVMVMAGNPYTGSGETLRLPDMLTNRADVHNLGDVAESAGEVFARSYITNAAAQNPVLAPVVAASVSDLEAFCVAAGRPVEASKLSRPYSPHESDEIAAVVAHLAAVRDRLLAVNDAYIRSANTAADLRGEPMFGLQGSYRNMTKLAGGIVAANTAEEVDAMVRDHYRAESQTLGNAATWNLARLAEIFDGDPSEADKLREAWAATRAAENPAAVVREGLELISDAIHHNTTQFAPAAS